MTRKKCRQAPSASPRGLAAQLRCRTAREARRPNTAARLSAAARSPLPPALRCRNRPHARSDAPDPLGVVAAVGLLPGDRPAPSDRIVALHRPPGRSTRTERPRRRTPLSTLRTRAAFGDRPWACGNPGPRQCAQCPMCATERRSGTNQRRCRHSPGSRLRYLRQAHRWGFSRWAAFPRPLL